MAGGYSGFGIRYLPNGVSFSIKLAAFQAGGRAEF
jgi:hypothetical protein